MFQSTPSLRSATRCGCKTGKQMNGFNPRTPCGVRLKVHSSKHQPGRFNPRTPCGVRRKSTQPKPRGRGFNPRTPCGVRLPPAPTKECRGGFQSTHSLRSATDVTPDKTVVCKVSIHALLAECDSEGRRQGSATVRFQSTHSLRSATSKHHHEEADKEVSIHALLAECDCARPYTLLLNRANHTLRQPP